MRVASALAGCVVAACLCACSEPASTPTAEGPPPAPPYNTDIDVAEVMIHAVDPAARAFWAGWGEVYTAKGMTDISAKTDEEWKKVEDGATMVMLATNTLMLPAYQRKPVENWNRYAKEVADLAILGREGADAHDKKAIEEIGGRLDVACDACHEAFRPENGKLP